MRVIAFCGGVLGFSHHNDLRGKERETEGRRGTQRGKERGMKPQTDTYTERYVEVHVTSSRPRGNKRLWSPAQKKK